MWFFYLQYQYSLKVVKVWYVPSWKFQTSYTIKNDGSVIKLEIMWPKIGQISTQDVPTQDFPISETSYP